MKKAAVSAAAAFLLLLSKLGATQLAAIYTALVVLPFSTRGDGALPTTLALAATISATWHSFDPVAAFVSVMVATSAVVKHAPVTAAPPTVAKPTTE